MFRSTSDEWRRVSKLAWRSLWRHRRRTLITTASIGMGLAIAIFFIALGEGVYSQIINDGVRMHAGHITLQHPEYRNAPAVDLFIEQVSPLRAEIDRLKAVERTKLLILGQGVAKSAAGAVGVAIMGVEPSVELATSPLARRTVTGSYLEDDDTRKVVVGVQLAERLRVDEGKKLVITTNNAEGELVEELFRVKGMFRTGSDEMDGAIIQIPLGFARRLFGLGPDSATHLGVVLHRVDDQPDALVRIRDLVRQNHSNAPVAVLPWQDVLPEVAAYIKMDRASNWVFQGLLMVIIFFTIFNTLLMSAVERDREFAVLLAVGTPPLQLKQQLLMEAFYLGAMGCGSGMLLGGLASWAMQQWGLDFGFLLPEGVTISGLAISTRIYARITFLILFTTGAIVFGSTLLCSLPPMRRIKRIGIAETLR